MPAATGPGPQPQRHHQAAAGVAVVAIVAVIARTIVALRPTFLSGFITVPPEPDTFLETSRRQEFAEIF
jgi:hypothetical protein